MTNLYGELAEYYDKIYHWKNYRKEVRKLKAIIQENKRSLGNSLLDVACGTGEHLRHLRDDFDCTGIDSSEQMLEVARRKLHGVKLFRGDMVDFDLGRKFDVVLCLFSSIGHLRNRKEVADAIANFAKHMEKGGVLVVEPWIRRSDWKDKTVHMQTYDAENLKIARINSGRAEGNFSLIDEGYVIGEAGKGVRFVRDRLKVRFFEPGPTLEAARRAGLTASFTEDSLMPERGLLIATKE